jgi:hypothetical protein
MAETDRFCILAEAKAWLFTRLMASHGIGGEAHDSLTEMMAFWRDVGYDQEHRYWLNEGDPD